MDIIKDILTSIRDWFRDRASNPLFAAFVVSWLVLNWRVVLVVLDEAKAIDKIRLLDNNFFPEPWHWFYYGLVSPMLLAVTYVAVSPYVFRIALVYYRKQQHFSKSRVMDVDKVVPVTPEEAERLRQDSLDSKRALRNATTAFKALEAGYLVEMQDLRNALTTSSPPTIAKQEPLVSQTAPAPEATSTADDQSDEPVSKTASSQSSDHPIKGKMKFTADEVVFDADDKWYMRDKDFAFYSTTSEDSKRFQRNLSILNDLSPMALTLLREASKLDDGEIQTHRDGSRRHVHIGHKDMIGEGASHRKQAEAYAAINELEVKKLIELYINGTTLKSYQLTSLGYEITDIIKGDTNK